MGKLIVEKDGVRGDVADIAQLFKETGVNLDQFLTTNQNPISKISVMILNKIIYCVFIS